MPANISRPIAVQSMGLPKEGPCSVPVICDFTAAPVYPVDLTNLFNQNYLSRVACVFADNSLNSSPLTLSVADTQQRITWPANSYGYMPVLQSTNLKFTVASQGAFVIELQFLNFAIAPGIYSANGQPAVNANGALSVSDALLEGALIGSVLQVGIAGNFAYVDASGTITLGGTAQTLLAANANRRAIQIQNTSAGNLFYRFTGAAANNTGFLLVPNQYYESAPGMCSNQALSIWGATTGQTFSLTWA